MFLLKFSTSNFDRIFEHDIRFQTLGRSYPSNEIVYQLETVLYFRIANTFFSTTLGTNKHVVNRFLYPFCVPGKGFFFVGRWERALPYMQIADASYPSVNPSENT